jgi:arginyl-tRNA synthetase
MKTVLTPILRDRLTPVLDRLGAADTPLEVQLTPDCSKGDFSLNVAMRLAKAAKCAPLKLAEEIAGLLRPATEWFRAVEVAPPGFINLFLAEAAIERTVNEHARAADLGLRRSGRAQRVVVDYSSVNIAKQMHVGHLRSTIIGDVLARVIAAHGDEVIRQNHLGDWGLPMAMVLWKAEEILRRIRADDSCALERELTLERQEQLYRSAGEACKQDPAAAAACHDILVRLQKGEQPWVRWWESITRLSMQEVYRIYEQLGVLLRPEDERGESFYRNLLAPTVETIRASGHLTESEGAQCVFLEQFKSKEGAPLPIIVQKSDGGFNYATFDLAGIRFRIQELQADRVIYVTDARQALHFAQVFAAAQTCGLTARAGNPVVLEHVPFGSVLGEDNKPLKTRSGENVKLAELLSEAVERAYAAVQEKNAALADETKRAVAHAVGIGAVKYADLSQNRNNDYVFAFDRMLAFNGNTAPYLQYAHARICSIFRKGKADLEASAADTAPIRLGHPAERALALKLLEFPQAVAAVAADLRPHILCNYLYETAGVFTAFYDACPVLTATDDEQRETRLAMCRLTRRTLARGLDLLGIAAPQEM